MDKTKIIAHRGASYHAPENTILAFEKAIDMGVDGIEFDVQLSKDGQIVVIHDDRVDRTGNGKGYVKDLTLDKLKKLDFGTGFDSRFAGTQIPTLEEVFTLFKGWNGLINIEIKGSLQQDVQTENHLIKKLVTMVKKYRFEDRTVISSFNHRILKNIKKITPDIKTGALYVCGLIKPWDYATSIDVDLLHPFFHNIIKNPKIVKECRQRQIDLITYTVDDENHLDTLFGLKVFGVITNRPDIALKVRD